MFLEYMEQLRAQGKRAFTTAEVVRDLGVSDVAAQLGLWRLKCKGKLITPLNGWYVMIPPERLSYGCIPAEELVPLMMEHLRAQYYVGLLSAAAYYGAAHHKPARFQVVTPLRVKHRLVFGQVSLELIYKKLSSPLPVRSVTVGTGYLKVASAELVAIDLFKFPQRAGGLNHIATVLTELLESLDADKLIALAHELEEVIPLQRIGYVVEQLEVMDEDKQRHFIDRLAQYLAHRGCPFVPLVACLPKSGFSRSSKWKIIENCDIESDL